MALVVFIRRRERKMRMGRKKPMQSMVLICAEESVNLGISLWRKGNGYNSSHRDGGSHDRNSLRGFGGSGEFLVMACGDHIAILLYVYIVGRADVW